MNDVQVGGRCTFCGGTGEHTFACQLARVNGPIPLEVPEPIENMTRHPLPEMLTPERLEALKALVKTTTQEYLVESGLVGVLEKTQAVVTAADAAFDLIETDPHSWSPRPCPTCRTVSTLIGRDFGCVKVRAGG